MVGVVKLVKIMLENYLRFAENLGNYLTLFPKSVVSCARSRVFLDGSRGALIEIRLRLRFWASFRVQVGVLAVSLIL